MVPDKPMFSNEYLKKLIVPLILEQTLVITVGMADSMMVASAGEAAVSGVSLVDMINNLIIAVLAALATGGAVVTSQCLGAGKRKDALRASNQLLYTLILAGALIMALSVAFRKPFLKMLFGTIEQDVMDSAMIYFLITALSFPFLAVYNGSAALCRCMGNSKITLKISVIMNLINIIGNAIFVLGLHMGAAGVAIPSLISRAVAAFITTWYLRDQTLTVHYLREKPRLDFSIIRKILSIGIPSGVENGIFHFGRVLVVRIIATFGTVQIAANGVANTLDAMGVIVGQAISLAMITVIGQCVGAGDEKQVRYYTWKLMGIAYVGVIGVGGIILLFLDPLLSLYHLQEETTRLAAVLCWIHIGFSFFMWPMSFAFPNMLRSCNDVRFPMYASIISMCVFRIGFSQLLGVHFGLGAIGVWIAMIIDWVCRISCFLYRYIKGTWRKTAHLTTE